MNCTSWRVKFCQSQEQGLVLIEETNWVPGAESSGRSDVVKQTLYWRYWDLRALKQGAERAQEPGKSRAPLYRYTSKTTVSTDPSNRTRTSSNPSCKKPWKIVSSSRKERMNREMAYLQQNMQGLLPHRRWGKVTCQISRWEAACQKQTGLIGI